MTQSECKALWLGIKDQNPTIEELEAIDKATPWSNIEPQWWLDMMKVLNKLYKEKNND